MNYRTIELNVVSNKIARSSRGVIVHLNTVRFVIFFCSSLIFDDFRFFLFNSSIHSRWPIFPRSDEYYTTYTQYPAESSRKTAGRETPSPTTTTAIADARSRTDVIRARYRSQCDPWCDRNLWLFVCARIHTFFFSPFAFAFIPGAHVTRDARKSYTLLYYTHRVYAHYTPQIYII